MIEASVGFHCPDDVRAAARSVRAPRTALGGRVTADTARVSTTLVVVNVLVFLVGLAGLLPRATFEYGNLALLPAGPGRDIGVAAGEHYRLLTAAFLHAGTFHLLTNMFALVSLGPVLEQALGRVRFLTLYVVSALGGSTLSYLVSDPGTFGVGASGAIFGLFGAYYVVVHRVGGDTGSIVMLLAINLVITFALPIIDWRAHVGGLLTGSAVAAAYAYAPRGARRAALQAAGVVAVAALLLLAVVLRTGQLTDA